MQDPGLNLDHLFTSNAVINNAEVLLIMLKCLGALHVQNMLFRYRTTTCCGINEEDFSPLKNLIGLDTTVVAVCGNVESYSTCWKVFYKHFCSEFNRDFLK